MNKINSEILFCIPMLWCVFIHVTVTFLSALTSLALLLWPLSLTIRFCTQNCCSLDVLCFSLHFSANSRLLRENPRRSAVSEILKPPCLAPTIIPRSKSLRSHFFPILTFGLKNSWTSWPHVCMLLCIWLLPHDWLIKYHCINKLVCRCA